MGDIVRIPDKLADTRDLQTRAEDAFQAYCEAARRAQSTFRIDDGFRAGQAWAAFLSLFAEVQVGASRK